MKGALDCTVVGEVNIEIWEKLDLEVMMARRICWPMLPVAPKRRIEGAVILSGTFVVFAFSSVLRPRFTRIQNLADSVYVGGNERLKS